MVLWSDWQKIFEHMVYDYQSGFVIAQCPVSDTRFVYDLSSVYMCDIVWRPHGRSTTLHIILYLCQTSITEINCSLSTSLSQLIYHKIAVESGARESCETSSSSSAQTHHPKACMVGIGKLSGHVYVLVHSCILHRHFDEIDVKQNANAITTISTSGYKHNIYLELAVNCICRIR